MKKPSFIQRLTGATDYDEYEEYDDFYEEETPEMREDIEKIADAGAEPDMWEDDVHEPEEGELPIDMYETDDAIVINTLVAGVDPSDLEISITRDKVTIRGSRLAPEHVADEEFMHRELFWGSFARTVELPDEVVIDESEAKEQHGLLRITLPRLDKHRSTRLPVKTTK